MKNLRKIDLKAERSEEIDPDEFSRSIYGMDEETLKGNVLRRL